MTPPTDLCTSPLFSIRETPHSGRGIYARKRITKTTLLFETPGLSASVVYRQYRKEVCTYCFAYDRGRQWKLRDAQTGVAFCGEECRELWKGEFSLDDHAIRLEALSAVEALGKSSRQKTTAADDEVERQPSPPNEEIIAAAWHTAERTAELIRAARLSDRASKAERRALNQVLSVPSSMDNLSYILSCVLCAAFDSSSWTDILHLETDHTPPTPLHNHIHRPTEHKIRFSWSLAHKVVSIITQLRIQIAQQLLVLRVRELGLHHPCRDADQRTDEERGMEDEGFHEELDGVDDAERAVGEARELFVFEHVEGCRGQRAAEEVGPVVLGDQVCGDGGGFDERLRRSIRVGRSRDGVDGTYC
ncbi:putative protein lysine methyltransferase [Phaeomoniella chlamydospora]|uniref:Uncharacterized protein n=1 Tax=Phaeomoniella chlamydospora TaxID=158046 RepID=A0A0G2DZM6_PHACM|nr:putative protein lysine methyltransferase [Phaeomoniella chlamydospora]